MHQDFHQNHDQCFPISFFLPFLFLEKVYKPLKFFNQKLTLLGMALIALLETMLCIEPSKNLVSSEGNGLSANI